MAGLNNLTFMILSQIALSAFEKAILAITVFSRNCSADAVNKGDKIKVPFVGNQVDAARNWAGSYVIDGQDADGLEIAINKRKYVSWGLTTEQLATMPQLTLEMFAQKKGQVLAEAFMTDVLSVVTAANYGAAVFTGAGSTMDGDSVIDLKTACDAANMPKQNRSLVLDSAYTGNILKDIKPAYALGSDSAIREGVIGRIAGFDVQDSNLIPANGEHLTGFIAHPDAVLLATRTLIPEDTKGVVDIATVTSPASGITLVSKDWYDPETDKRKRVLEINYGYLKGNAAALKRIVSQAP